MKILLINLHSSRNAGDAALALASIEQLQKHFPGVTITLAMNDPASHQGPEPVVGSFYTCFVRQQDGVTLGWRWFAMPWFVLHSLLIGLFYRLFKRPAYLGASAAGKRLLQAYLEADLVVSCPGNMLMSFGRFGLPLLVALYTIIYAWLLGKPLYMLPQSIGPFKRQWEEALVKWSLSKFRLVMVREPVSYELVSQFGFGLSRLHLVPDIAFALSAAPEDKARQFLNESGLNLEDKRPLLGVTVINWRAQNRWFLQQEAYEQAVREAVRMFINQYQGRVIFFPQVCGPSIAEDDRLPARRIAQGLPDEAEHITLLESPLGPALLKSLYGEMDIFLGTRMHSNIFALAENVPVLAIGYLYKTRGIMTMLQLEDWVIDIDDLNDERLTAKLAALWLARAPLRSQVETSVLVIMEQIALAGELIATDHAKVLEKPA